MSANFLTGINEIYVVYRGKWDVELVLTKMK